MAEIDTLLEGYKRFYARNSYADAAIFKQLATEGQSSKTLIIACSDSRVDPSIITDAGPGDIFAIRNVANLVPPYQNNYDSYHGTSAAIEFAIRNLKVENVIVMGHSRCAGIHALLNSTTKGDNKSYVDAWVNIAKKAKDQVDHQTFASADERQTCCEKESILVSLENLMTFPWVKEQVDKKALTLHGWYFSIFDRCLQILDKTSGTFQKFKA